MFLLWPCGHTSNQANNLFLQDSSLREREQPISIFLFPWNRSKCVIIHFLILGTINFIEWGVEPIEFDEFYLNKTFVFLPQTKHWNSSNLVSFDRDRGVLLEAKLISVGVSCWTNPFGKRSNSDLKYLTCCNKTLSVFYSIK